MLELKDIKYKYKNSSQDVLKGINATFEKGKFHSIIGPSGSGKSTLLSIMAGMDRPTSGDVLIDNVELKFINLDSYRKNLISMIFQQFHLFPNLTVEENVTYIMQISGIKKEEALKRARESLSKVGISEDKYKRFPSNLSGGEQQRVAIARAISTDAKVILADEPTGNLDEENTDIVINLLKKFAHESGYCVIVVTHNIEIANTSDSVFKMSNGILNIR